jgi:Uma2 family endonuclease
MSATAARKMTLPVTLADLLALPDEGHGYEIVDGELVEKETSGEHGRAQTNLVTRLNSRFGRRPGGQWPGGWWFATEVLIAFPEVKDPLRPDVVGWRRDKVPAFPTGTVLTTIPDWICEILSPSNFTNDTIKKKRTYHRAKVGHYWLIDPIQETLQVFRWETGGYLEILSAERTDQVRAEPFDGEMIRVAAIFGDDEEEP